MPEDRTDIYNYESSIRFTKSKFSINSLGKPDNSCCWKLPILQTEILRGLGRTIRLIPLYIYEDHFFSCLVHIRRESLQNKRENDHLSTK